jgi:DNA-binding NarL/FixJ family response regulator
MKDKMSRLNRILVACENTLLREGISKILHEDEGIQVVAEACNLLELIQFCEEFQFDILLLDADLQGLKLSKILESIRNKSGCKVILIIGDKFDEDQLIDAILLGVRGYLSKDSNSNQLKSAINFVSDGQHWVKREIMTKALEASSYTPNGRGKRANAPIYNLTKTELKIFKMVLEGHSNKQIARDVFLSEKTVKFHLYKIFRKLAVKNRSELILYGYRKGIVAN